MIKSVSATILRHSLLAGSLALLFVVGVAGYLYSAGSGAPLMFDDTPNLLGLGNVEDIPSALQFVLSSDSTPTGRPISRASFLLNTDDWPSNTSAMRAINIAIHCLNGLLLFAILARLLRWLSIRNAISIALVSSSVWLLHPYLVSTTLSIVQRMTLLSALFVLSGMLAFLHGRAMLAKAWLPGLAWMSFGVIWGCGLGILAKENAILFPLFVAILELSILVKHAPPPSTPWISVWRYAFVRLPILMIFGYLAWQIYVSPTTYALRDFSLADRLASEAVIVPFSIRQILFPNILVMGPFQDDMPIYTWLNWQPWVGLFFLISFAAAAIHLRTRVPLLFVSVFGFLSGHLLESTTIPLELYFEHRNYLPSTFIVVSVVTALWSLRAPLAWFVCIAWISTSAFLTWKVSSLWGHETQAGGAWFAAHPASARAAAYLANMHAYHDDNAGALSIMLRAYAAAPRSSILALQSVQLACAVGYPEPKLRELADGVTKMLPTSEFSFTSLNAIGNVRYNVSNNICPTLTMADVDNFVSAMLSNPRFLASNITHSSLIGYQARRAIDSGERSAAIGLLRQAFDIRPTNETALVLVEQLRLAGDDASALKITEDPRLGYDSHLPNRRYAWERALGSLHREISTTVSTQTTRDN